jgi:hypothetical protein
MLLFRERLYAPPTGFISSALVIPAVIIVFAPINFAVGVVLSIALYAVAVILLLATAPTVEVTEDELRAGRAHIERTMIGNVTAYTGEEATLQRGQKLDARAWLLIRGWVKPVVKVPVLDADDPVPYWIVSTRRPAELVRVLNDHAATHVPPSTPEGR